jgi:hypothetical protein
MSALKPEAVCTCSPEHLDAGGFDPWCEAHADASVDA